MIRRALVAISVVILIGSSASGDEDALDLARQHVQETYRQRIEETARTTDEADDLALAQELLREAGDPNRTPDERFALADHAAMVAAGPGMPDGAEFAARAIISAESIRPYPPAEKEQRMLEVAVARMQRLQRERADEWAMKPAAEAVVELSLAYCLAAAGVEPLLNEANAALMQARTVARQHELEGLEDTFAEAEAALAEARRRQLRFNQARGALADAEERNDPTAIAAAKVALAEVFMEFDGDIASAAGELAGTGDPRERALMIATEFLAGSGEPTTEDLLVSAVALTEWIRRLAGAPRQSVADHALAMCDAAAAETADSVLAARAGAVRARLEQFMGQSRLQLFRDGLAEAYGSMWPDLELLPNGQARMSYRFQTAPQLDDWRLERGAWRVAQGAMVCAGGEGGQQDALATMPVRFRADRPLRVTFKVSGTHQIGFSLDFYPWGGGRQRGYQAAFGATFLGRSRPGHRVQGSKLSIFGRDWVDEDLRLAPGQSYEMQFVLDGAGGCTWTIDGRPLYAHREAVAVANRIAGSLELRLQTWNASTGAPTGFDDLVIEGEPLPGPDWRPEE